MSKLLKIIYVGIFSVLVVIGWSGCTKKPNQEEVAKLEQARVAAESAEKKLSELRQERMQLEQDLQSKQSDLKGKETERDTLSQKIKN
jgi:hypothetical protein